MNRSKRGLLLAFLSFLLIQFLPAQQGQNPPVQLVPVAENLYQVSGGRGAQGGAFVGETGVLLIDAKMDQNSFNQVVEEIKKVTDKPILYLVNTHSDGDHINGNR